MFKDTHSGMRRTILFLTIASICTLTEEQTLLESIFSFIGEGGAEQTSEPTDTTVLLPEYDFIVVGAGTAGSVITNRLSENPEWTVLLLEAGRAENYIMDLPVLANYLQFTDANWKYLTQPSERYCLAMDERRCHVPRGKVMGGSSVLNYMIYTRGHKKDFDNWADMGNEGWSYDDVLAYYKKIEDFKIPEYQNSSFHSTGGNLRVAYAPYRTKLAEAMVKASVQYGMQEIDYNGDGTIQSGVSYLQVTIKDGIRHSASRAYLHPIKERKNFHLRKYSMVKKILIDPNTKEAEGVEFVYNGATYRVGAKKEVIVSGGAVNSPQLLMLSGIGPKKHLNQMGIPVLKNLKVGFNLMDHVAAGGVTFKIDKPYSVRTMDFLQREPLIQFLYHHKGPLTLPGGCEVLTFNNVKNPTDPSAHADMELLFQAGAMTSDPVLRRNFRVRDEIYDVVFKPLENGHSFMLLPMLMRPKSRGRITLQDNNYLSQPNIFPNYFDDEEDLHTMVEGIKLAINITHQAAMQEIGARLSTIPVPTCAQHTFGTDEYWGCHTKHFSFTIHHLSGTCKMGPKTDKRAVVDPQLRVHGIGKLRVIDASIIPEIPVAHTNAPTFMIAEKGADMIKQAWQSQTEK